MTNKLDDKICPICGKNNNCMAHNDKPCWCLDIKIPQGLLDLIPESKKMKECICLECIQEFKKNPNKFIRKM